MELYIHIPFCVRKCNYCDFLSFPSDENAMDVYFSALGAEAALAGRALRDARKHGEKSVITRADSRVTSVFIGGGTPSLPGGDRIAALLDQIRSAFSVADDAEISIEINPGTADLEKMRMYIQAGINRMSIGCQSFSGRELKMLGRIHTREDIYACVKNARKAGCRNLNLDLISAVPGQTEEQWKDHLRAAAALEPEHISAYSLIIEEGTPFGAHAEDLDLPGEEAERAMYLATAEVLARYGYEQYEISNYAKPGCACRHNVGYWTGVPYLGLGLGAASYLTGREQDDLYPAGSRAVRFSNTSDIREYIDALSPAAGASGGLTALRTGIEYLEDRDLQSEFMILGLRMNRGVSEEEFRKRFGISLSERFGAVTKKYQDAGLLKRENGRIALTREGLLLANVVMADYLEP